MEAHVKSNVKYYFASSRLQTARWPLFDTLTLAGIYLQIKPFLVKNAHGLTLSGFAKATVIRSR